jgi:hypothetical protein
MPDKPPRRSLFSVLGQLNDIQNLRREELAAEPLEPALALLKAWQSQRLARTYADLLATDRYRLACRFFLELRAARPRCD